MAVVVSTLLYYKAGPAMDIAGEELDSGDVVRQHAEDLHRRLIDVGEMVDKLLADGWKCTCHLDDLLLVHSGVYTEQDAK